MSAPVDVLALLQQIADGEGDTEVLSMRVRAAVAELIEAAKGVDATKGSTSAERIRLRLALARIGGAK